MDAGPPLTDAVPRSLSPVPPAPADTDNRDIDVAGKDPLPASNPISDASHFTETSGTPKIYATAPNLDTQTAVKSSQLPALRDILNPATTLPPALAGSPRSRAGTPMKSSTPSNGDGKSPETRPLNVTDALSYLDAVKVQFQDKPDVYNHFLDIMKDFKSQVIDTPGVIERVSMLFHGNPYLIQGFNTFLPPGYRIEMSADPRDPNVITVTTPSGTTTQKTNTFGQHHRPGRDAGAPAGTPGIPFSGNGALPAVSGGTHSRPMTPHAYQLSHLQPPFEGVQPLFSPGLHGASTNAAASFLGNLNNRNVEKQQAGEFNHAIQYLNKIKARYSDDPDKYKNFLEILQTYQKEQRGLNDSQVYMHVQGLFKDAPDLLAEFKDFLPEITGQAAPSGVVGILPQPPGGPGVNSSPWSADAPGGVDRSDKAGKKPIPPLKRRKKPIEKDPTPVPPAKTSTNRSKRAKHHHKGESPAYSPYQAPHSPPNGHLHSHGHSAPQSSFSHSNQTAGPSAHSGSRTMTTPDELLFFERAKKALETRETYDEFLKMLSLFSKDIIDSKTLIRNAQTFLGDGELLAQFKELMRWDERQHSVEYGPPGSIRTGPPEALSAVATDEGQGMSYRRLPASEVNLACSGRDELARSVLNDQWVSHPTWASEEAGFVAHKKNINEDALHACEQERHEFDTFIQANARTIAVLEPIYERMQTMTHEEKLAFKLPPDLGGPTKSIYLRLIKRIYGGAQWEEVWDALQKAPAIAVPVVLDRLHIKDAEWRREQRTWSRIWRGVEAKNYYKSLDHQGNNDYKNTEKKSITAKYLVADIENKRKIKLRDRENWSTRHPKRHRRWWAEGSVGYQLEHAFPDISVLHDSLKMVYSFLDHSQAMYSQPERRAVETFLRQFVPLLLMHPEAEFNAACGPLEPAHAEEMATADTNGIVDGSGVPAGDLRKKLLETAHETGLDSRAVSPPGSTSSDDLKIPTDDVWIRESSVKQPAATANGTSHSKKSPFFANTTYYTLLRLLHLLYSRLLMCKEIGAKMTAEKYASLAPNPIAVELGLDDPNGPTAVLAQLIEALGTSGSRDETNVLYMYLLDAWEKVFDNELEQSVLEEHMRWFFGKNAYQVFTLDKTVTAIIKQVQGVLADQKSLDLRSLLEGVRSTEDPTNRDIIRYRREAETNVGSDEHLYRVDWNQTTKTMRIQLLGADDPSVEERRASGVDRWREYIDSYLLSHPTEWMPEADEEKEKSRGMLFLRRCLTADESPPSLGQNDIAIQISLGTYKLFYEAGTEDVFLKGRTEEEEKVVRERALVRHEERKRSVWLQ